MRLRLELKAGLAGALVALVTAGAGLGQDYPARALNFIVPYTPGGAADIGSRQVGDALSKVIGQPVVIDNVPGAGGSLGVQKAVNAEPDGYTFVYGTLASVAMNPYLYDLTYDPRTDLVPVHGLGDSSNIVVIAKDRPYKTLEELVAYARANPGAINYASAGIGSGTHIAGEIFQLATGTQLTHIPYKGSNEALTDLVAGVADVMFDYATTSLAHIEAGSVLGVAAMSGKRIDVLPDLRTMTELGYPEGTASLWSGIFVPKGTPEAVIAKLSDALDEAYKDPGVADAFTGGGRILLTDLNWQTFPPYVASEIERYSRIADRLKAPTN